jgi:DNA-binding IclR family transcriptional regulator
LTRRTETTKYQVRAVSAAFRVLNALAEQPQQTLSQLASALDMTTTLTYRMLATLEAEEMVHRDEHRRYSLGPRAMYLGYQAQRSLPITQLAQPILDRLAERTNESVHLVLRTGLERVIVALKESPQPVRVSTPIGTRFPMYYGGTGLCMFAYLTEDEQRQVLAQGLRPKTRETELDPEKILAVAREIRQRGYHVAVRDFADSAFSIAAPVFGADGEVVASICVVGPESRLTAESRESIVSAVVETGAALSAALGHAPSTVPVTAGV